MPNKVSVIVSVFNMAEYLDKCMKSILCQTLHDIEILLIDDGSNDGSSGLCDIYARNDSRVKVFHKSNDGPASSKNHGLEHASGEYAIFLDADDWWLTDNALETLTETADRLHADLVKGEYIAVDANGKETRRSRHLPFLNNQTVSRDKIFRLAFNGEFSCCLTLLRKSSLDGLTFDESFSFDEDADLFARYFIKPRICGYSSIYFYAYRLHPHSVTANHKVSKLRCSFALCDTFFRCSLETSGKLQKEYRRYSVEMYQRAMEMLASDAWHSRSKEIISTLMIDRIHKKTVGRMFRYGIFNRHFFSILASPGTSLVLIRFKRFLLKSVRKPGISVDFVGEDYVPADVDPVE